MARIRQATIYWRVRALRGEEKSDWSPVVSFTIGVAPAAPGEGPKKKEEKPADPDKMGHDVSGQIRDALARPGGAKPPLGGVSVTINGTTVATAANGTFTIPNVPNGNHPVTLALANYTFPNNLTVTVNNGNLTGLVYEGTGDSHTIARGGSGLPALGARKDTTILATKKGSTSNVMCEFNNANQQGWDRAHHQAAISGNHLESWWCWAVGIAMVNNYYGGTLTRDEIVIRVRGDLLHDRDAGSHWNQYTPGLQWAFQQNNFSNFDIRNRGGANITEAEVKAWLDANRPLYFRRPGHIMVIDRYLYWGGNLWARFVNTDNNGATRLWQFSTVNNGGVIAPKNGIAANSRKTDPEIAKDPDGDGLNNYDEARFGTNAAKADSDDDKVPDKAEIRSWSFPRKPSDGFTSDGGNVAGHTFVNKHIDGLLGFFFSDEPQVDEDSDNGGIKDGDEDLDLDGCYEEGETDPYDRSDDKVLDLAFVIDSTGSMSDDIAAVKNNLNGILDRVVEQFPNWRIAVVDYRDYPPEASIPYRANLAFSNDEAAVRSAINALGASGGGDEPESLYTALINTINAVSLTDGEGRGWRGTPGDGIKRAIVYMTDASAQSPEPVTGYTAINVITALNSGGLRLGDPTSGGSKSKASQGKTTDKLEGEDSAERSGSISLYPIVIGGSSQARADAEELVGGASGEVIRVSGAGQVADAILAALDDIAISPDAVLTVTDDTGGTEDLLGKSVLVADMSRSFDPEGCGIVSYDWDWNADGTYDESSITPVLSHDYGPTGFGGRLRARITTFGGATAVANFTLETTSLLTIESTGPLMLNRQTGLYQQTIMVSNPGSATVDALRITLGGLPEGVELRGGLTEGSSIVYNDDLLPGESIAALVPLSGTAGESDADTAAASAGGKSSSTLLTKPERGNWRFGATTGILMGVDAKFRGLGRWDSNHDPTFGTSGLDRTYDDGFNRVDSSGNRGGDTWNWGYQDESRQFDAAVGTLTLSTFESLRTGDLTDSENPEFGLNFFGLYDLGPVRLGGRGPSGSRWGFKTGFTYQNIGISDDRPLTSDVLQRSDTFSLNGTIPPRAPYSGSFTGPGPLLSDSGAASQTVFPGGALVFGDRDLDVDLFLFSFGPYLEIPVHPRWSLFAEAGVNLGLSNGDYRYHSTTTIPGVGSQTNSGSDSETDFVGGFYAGIGASYQLNDDWALYSDLKYQYLSPIEIKADESEGEVNFDSAFAWNLGVLFRF